MRRGNCFIPSENGCFLKCVNYTSKKDLTNKNFKIAISNKRQTTVMSKCRIPDFSILNKMDVRVFDDKSKILHPRTVDEKIIGL